MLKKLLGDGESRTNKAEGKRKLVAWKKVIHHYVSKITPVQVIITLPFMY